MIIKILKTVMPFLLLISLSHLVLSAVDLPEWKQDFWPEDDAWKKTTQHFRLSNGAEPQTLDPQTMTGVTEHRIALGLYEGLCTNDPSTLAIRPGVAESWTISDDGLTYTFKIHTNAKWSDGKQLTSFDFQKSWKRLLQKETESEYVYQIYPVKNAQAYLQGSVEFDAVGIRCPDAHTLVVTLHQPCAYFLELCAFATLAPVRTDIIEQHKDKWTLPENNVSNGPFMLHSWKQRQVIELVANPHYWDAGFVKLGRISFYPYDDNDASYMKYLAGDLDWLSSVPQKRSEELRAHADYFVEPYLGTYFYRFNCNKPPFDNKLVRQALSLAIDRRIITQHITKAGEEPATWFCPNMNGYEHVTGLAFNAKAAQALLTKAGYPDGTGFPASELMFNTSDAHKEIAESITQQWRDVLNIHVRMVNKEWKMYLQDMTNKNYDIMRSSWIGDYSDPNTFFDMFVTDGGNNRTGWSHAGYDALLIESQAEQDVVKRLKIFQKMERILIEDEMPIMPVYMYVYQGMLRESVLGFEPNIRDMHPYQYIWMEE